MPTIVARWQDWAAEGLEHLVLHDDGSGVFVVALVIGDADGQRFASHYIIECDSKWRTRSIALSVIDSGSGLILKSDGAGAWRDASGGPVKALDGAIDVDITATPFTNTLPIRRLGLEAGQSADVVVAYIDVPSLTVAADPQRYTCLEPMRRYRFESQGGDFIREIEVDERGLVVRYPGLFKRVL